ncbi:hypothetical protein VNO78_20004 [Psophocarpus tetragonolobus]|uniref:Uncharacterized protein n=1 Tax=Psophocarpus tetragonolobus TaxID=3891 RepID=A0AAN9SDN1_PSOTE
MSSKKQTPFRVFGQLTIASTFRNVPQRNPSEGNERNQASGKSKTGHHPLSDILNPKPNKFPHLSPTVPGKSTPFLSPLGIRRGKEGGTVKEVEKEKNNGNDDKVIFESFKRTEEDKGELVCQIGDDELENSVADDVQESKKRKAPFEGRNENQTAHVVVLGGESTLKPKKGQIGNGTTNKKPRPLYNHYANGRGWWDYDMEGVDNEELGSNEVWEGVGSTTLGGIIDWH